MKKQQPDNWEPTLRAEIEDALSGHVIAARRKAFSDTAVAWVPFMRTGLLHVIPEPRRVRQQLRRALDSLEDARAALSTVPKSEGSQGSQPESIANYFAAMHITTRLSQRGTRMVGPNFSERPRWDGGVHSVSIGEMLHEIVAATREALDEMKGVGPGSRVRFLRDYLSGLADAYQQKTGKSPRSTPGGLFFRCARAVCVAAGCQGLTQADLAAALRDLRTRLKS